jgi:hypothetical protein
MTLVYRELQGLEECRALPALQGKILGRSEIQ